MLYLYAIMNVLNNKVYIGQTVRPKERWSQHKAYAKGKKPVQYIHQAMAKCGADNFVFEVIATCRTEDDANKTEEVLVARYDSQNKDKGYNISRGGDPAWNRGLPREQQPMYGKKQSDHQKQRMSEIHSGKVVVHSKETRQKMSISGKGKSKSEEWKEKHSGENHHSSKLTKEIVSVIRERFSRGERKASLAREYGVTKQTIHNIILVKIWR